MAESTRERSGYLGKASPSLTLQQGTQDQEHQDHSALVGSSRHAGDTHLAHGPIFRASPRLMQKPAPPVANQKCTGLWMK